MIVIPFSGVDRVKGLENYEGSPKIIIDKSFVSDDRCDVGSTQTIGFHAKWSNNYSDVANGVLFIKCNGICEPIKVLHVSVFMKNEVKMIVNKVNCSNLFSITQINIDEFNKGTPSDLSQFDVIVFGLNDFGEVAGDWNRKISRLNELEHFVKNGGGIVWTHDTIEQYWDYGEPIEKPAGINNVDIKNNNNERVWYDSVIIVKEHEILHTLFDIGEINDIIPVQITHTNGGRITSAIVIMKGYHLIENWCDPGATEANNFYLAVNSYGKGRVAVIELGHSLIKYPEDLTLKLPSEVECKTFVNTIIWVSNRHPLKKKIVTDESGWAYFNESLSSVRRRSWRVVGVDCNGVTDFEQVAPSPSIIWDRVNLKLSVERSRVDVGSKAPIRVEGVYEYDGAPFQGSVVFNDSLTKGEVGRYGYRVVGIADPLYGLSVFNSNDVSVIFDRVNIKLSVDDSRIDVGETLPYSWVGEYEYDGSRFEGSITLNDTVTKDDVGRYVFTVASIFDEKYGLTAFSSNAIDCIWDRIVIVDGGVSKEITSIGRMEAVWFKALYEYDKEPFTGEDGVLYVNGEPMIWSSHDEIWKYTAVREEPGSIIFEITGVDDRKHGLTTIEDLVGGLTIEWQRPFWQEPVGIILIGGVIITTILLVVSSMRRKGIL